MAVTNNPKLTSNARNLRRGMTKEEKHLWYDFLRNLPCKVHRQFVIGNYIVDFYCASANLVIELDGAQHFEDEALSYDHIRDDYLRGLGFTVLRYTNIEVDRSFRTVCEDIWNHLGLD